MALNCTARAFVAVQTRTHLRISRVLSTSHTSSATLITALNPALASRRARTIITTTASADATAPTATGTYALLTQTQHKCIHS